MGSLPLRDIPTLTPIEQISPKGWLRYVFPFRLPGDYDIDEVTRILREGFGAAKDRLPVLGCEVVPDGQAKQAGALKLQWIRDIDDPEVTAFAVKDLRAPGAFPHTYEDLKAKHFPVSCFPENLLMRRDIWAAPGDRLPVSLVQLNFIPGGMLMGWNLLHALGDGKAFHTWAEVWAGECRRIQGGDIDNPVVLPEAIFRDRERVMTSSGRNPGRVEDHPEFTVLPFTPQGAPPKMVSKDHRGQVFYFSPEARAAIKAEASPVNATEPSDQTWISFNDALGALVWRTVMAAQFPLEGLPEDTDPISVYNIAIDGRLRTDPPIHPQTQGCFLEWVAPSMSIRKMLTTASLADIAILIRKALLRIDGQFTDDTTALIEKLEDLNRIVPTAMLDVPGFNCIQSSWVNFNLYGLDWGHVLGRCIEAVRCPDIGVINGAQIVLPVLPDGGIEVLIGVQKDCLHRVFEDPLWMKFAEPR